MYFIAALSVVAFLAGAVASIVGFGIGSLLTPLLALQVNTKLAVAAVSIPHFAGTLLRCWMMRKDIDRSVLMSFGITSAVGGLIGALLHNWLASFALTIVFGVILIIAGIMGFGASDRLNLHGFVATAAGALSGFLGGLVGNQGGIRSAAMLNFQLTPSAFVATATAIGVMVDVARMPIYIATEFGELCEIWVFLSVATVAVVGGTFGGNAIVKKIDQKYFKRLVSAAVFILGAWMIWSGTSGRIR